jgi:hypothetical protein
VDIVGWVTPQASAARPKCRSLAKAKRSSSLSINKQNPSDILHLNAIMTITATTWQDTPKDRIFAGQGHHHVSLSSDFIRQSMRFLYRSMRQLY